MLNHLLDEPSGREERKEEIEARNQAAISKRWACWETIHEGIGIDGASGSDLEIKCRYEVIGRLAQDNTPESDAIIGRILADQLRQWVGE